jgi:hypothetical protein
MRSEAGKPAVGPTKRSLGVVPGPSGPPKYGDIAVGTDGMVRPRTGGMSTSLDSPEKLPVHRRPRALGGQGTDPVFETETTRLPETLGTHIPLPDHPDHKYHVLIEPSRSMSIEDLQASLASTRDLWREVA